MATETPSSAPKPAPQKPKGPVDQPFWVKYSEHHELPLSVSSSIFLHLAMLGLCGLILVGFLNFGARNRVPPIEPISLAPEGGGGGNALGEGEGPGNAPLQARPDATAPDPKLAEATQPEPDLAATPLTPSSLIEKNATERAFEVPLSSSAMKDKASDAQKAIQALQTAGKGLGGEGKGGGLGKGEGTGIGDKKGPGTGVGGTIRQKRQERWVMIFSTQNGRDYLAQLKGLGAILAIPTKDGGYMVYRNLASFPMKGHKENPPNRIFWVDDRPNSVQELALAMGLRSRPEYIAAFFPESLEVDLRNKERAQYAGAEENIGESTFRIKRLAGGAFDVELDKVRVK